jgi:hypothetical protein
MYFCQLIVLPVYVKLVHPILMCVLLGTSLYALYLGIQIRRTRTSEGDLKKELIKGRFSVRHYQIGAVLLSLLVIGALGGMATVYIDNGKLFVAPHLFVGLGMVALITTSASLVPFMQKHNWIRYVHISLNLVLLSLFAWQATTGIQVVQKLLSQS